MNKAQLIDKLYHEVEGLNKKQTEKMLDVLTDTIIEELKNDREVTITGFGTFLSRVRYSRGGVNPQNPKERITIPAVKVAKFKTGYNLKQALKGKR
ncbi:MAG TPA: HU family DNA-binding protein [bacterium]|jgi:DNA-binding protein HU-beta|nr:MAG: DNA-binding protein HU 1 [Parcubacteria group bacterium ADurb.Bin115]HNU81595.1 HU family DNA-binding protein [bacterium]HOD87183.1 HU family DNA-binding protein [bacterium]HPW05887.1 HU family DNA-binding protein [bacterium]HPY99646.1 HU family DNA-binding protein [bacterium]